MPGITEKRAEEILLEWLRNRHLIEDNNEVVFTSVTPWFPEVGGGYVLETNLGTFTVSEDGTVEEPAGREAHAEAVAA